MNEREKMKQKVFSVFLLRSAGAGMAMLLVCALPMLSSCAKKKEQPPKILGPTESSAIMQQFQALKKHLQQNPKDAEAWYDLADIYDQNNLFGPAAQAYKKAAELKPSGYTFLKLGMCYDASNQPKEAVSAYEKAVKYMPSYAVAYNNLGVAYGKIGENGKAIAAFKKALKLNPRYATARYDLGYAYLKNGDKKAALKQYGALEKVDQGMAYDLLKKIKAGKSATGGAGA